MPERAQEPQLVAPENYHGPAKGRNREDQMKTTYTGTRAPRWLELVADFRKWRRGLKLGRVYIHSDSDLLSPRCFDLDRSEWVRS